MLTGYPLEIALTAANSAAQAWYGYDQVITFYLTLLHETLATNLVTGCHQWNPDQPRLYQDLSPDQGLQHPGYHSKLLLRMENIYLFKTT